MKHIIKKNEPQEIISWKSKKNENWQPSYDKLNDPEKSILKKSLMGEQGYICCYCEQELKEEYSHIEHFKPQSKSKEDSLNYNNMLCSCQSNLKRSEPSHCGNLKGNFFDDLLVSPLNQSCENKFKFNFIGNISPENSDDEAALLTIKKLGLNIPKLNALRKCVIEAFIDDRINEIELKKFVNEHLKKTKDGKFNPFWTTINYLFEK